MAIRQAARHPNASREEEVVERGDIFFFYRPRVEIDRVEGVGDVQRFYMVLKPNNGPFRLTVIGRKRLPDVERHERTWGFVDVVTDWAREIEQELREQHYQTGTRGARTLAPARPAGEGGYAILRHGRNLHLTYELELPERPGEVQRELNIPHEGAFVLSIKNPEEPAPPGVGLREAEEAHYPEPLQEEFRGRRFETEDPHPLDYEGAEFVLIGAHRDPERTYGIDVEPERDDPLRRLAMSDREHPVEPLLKGQWR
ncbi:MAG TPA: hypothetical protein VGH40_09855 [Roseiarcus sp.]